MKSFGELFERFRSKIPSPIHRHFLPNLAFRVLFTYFVDKYTYCLPTQHACTLVLCDVLFVELQDMLWLCQYPSMTQRIQNTSQ